MQQTSESNNKVFVGSVPGYFGKSELANIFRKHGKISKIKLDYKADAPHLNKGFCVLTMQTAQDAARIIKIHEFHVSGGRYLVCKPYLQGQKLQDEILHHDKRRIILKQIPPEFTEHLIKSYFENNIGQVEVVFIYQTDDHTAFSRYSRKWRSGSVTFYSTADVEKLFRFDQYLQETTVILNGHHISVQRFKFQPIPDDVLHDHKDRQLINNHKRNLYERKASHVPRKNQKEEIPFEKMEFHMDKGQRIELAIRTLDHQDANLRFNVLKPQINRNNSPAQSIRVPESHQSSRPSVRTLQTAVGPYQFMKVHDPACRLP